jgi:hypothetical protein
MMIIEIKTNNIERGYNNAEKRGTIAQKAFLLCFRGKEQKRGGD